MDCTAFWCFSAYVFSAPFVLLYCLAYAYESIFSFLRLGLEVAIFDNPVSMACKARPVETEDPLTWFAL